MEGEIQSARGGLRGRSEMEKLLDRGFVWLTLLFAVGVGLVLLAIAGQVAIQSGEAIKHFGLGFLTTSNWEPNKDSFGALAQVYGTLVSSLLALFIAVPVGIGVSVFLSEDFDFLSKKVQTVLVFLVELLAAIPSVVYGLWGIFVLVPALRAILQTLFNIQLKGAGMLPAALVLAVMILPTITSISREALIAVPRDLRYASMGLGATRWETILQVILPAAFSGIVGAVMLALGRAMGETMAVTMLIGNRDQISVSLLEPANTISAQLATKFAEAEGLEISALMFAALILFGLTLLVNIFAELLILRVQRIK